MKRKLPASFLVSPRNLLLAAASAWTALSVSAFPIITSVVETGGDNEATDTVTAKWTGVTFSNGIAGEFLNPYTVPFFAEDVPAYVDRTHQWNGATVDLPLPSYLVGGEYIMIGNDNRDNNSLQLVVTLSEPALVYLLIDNRLTDGNAADPPESGLPVDQWVTGMLWVGTNGFQPVLNGLNRTGDPSVPDEVGVDEGGNGVGPGGDIQNYSSVYVKSVTAPGTISLYQANNSGRNMYGVVVTRVPGSPLNPPEITEVTPANGTLFYNPAGGLRFRASTVSPNRLDAANIHLTLNGTDVSAGLAVTGDILRRSVAYNSLQADTLYVAQIVVADQAGRATTNTIKFDTFTAATSLIIEAEDYNYGDGLFIDAPAPNAYAGLKGTAGTDYHNNNGTALAANYRTEDYVGIAISGDVARDSIVNAGATDYVVNAIQAGDWFKYTRAINAGTYQVYLRGFATAGQRVRLDSVAAGAAALGTFIVPAGAYTYAQLTDGLGNPVLVNLSGATTLRPTAEDANVNLTLNYLLLMPATGPAQAPYISALSPGAGATGVAPDAVVTIALANGASAVTPGSITLSFNGSDVTAAAVVSATPNGQLITYDPPDLLPANAPCQVALTYQADGNPFAANWTFTTGPAPRVIPSVYATAPGTGQGAGFNLKMRKAPDLNASGVAYTLANTAARAESQLADRLIDPDTGLPFINEAGGPNGDGLANAPTVNFEQLAAPSGFFPGDTAFPHVDPAVFADPNNMAMEATAYLELAAGFYRFGVRSDDGFKLTCGPVFSYTNLIVGTFEGGRGDGLPGGATEFDFQVTSAGLYPFRLIWYEGNGGARLEFYSVDRATFQRTLINDPSPGAVRAFMRRITQLDVPVCSITAPANGATFNVAPTNLTVSVNASVVSSTISKVEFYATSYGPTVKIGEAASAPYRLDWRDVNPGRYVLSAKATDARGFETLATPVRIVVGTPLSINFQATSAPEVPAGYEPDYGDVFGDRGNGYNYGWDLDNTANARYRTAAPSPDLRYATFNHLQKPQPAGSVWEIELPNGRYYVGAVAGDASNFDSVFDLQFEGVTLVSGTPNTNARWVEGAGAVTVTDGRLTVSNGPLAQNNKLCFVDIFTLPAEVAQPVFAQPTLSAGVVTVTWTNGGALQEAPALSGPWTPVAGNPQATYSTAASGPAKFFRVVVP